MIDVATRLCDRYRLETPLTTGGTARCYRGVDERLDRPVTVEVLAEAPDLALAQLDHPSLVRVYDVDEHEGEPFVVIELVEGPTLADRLADQGPMAPEAVGMVGRSIGAGLDHAHRLGISGFNLTTDTVVLSDPTTARLVDLGSTGDEADDVHALGLLLRECLGGNEPGQWPSLLDDMTQADPEGRPTVPEVLARLASVGEGDLTETRPMATPEVAEVEGGTRAMPVEAQPRPRRQWPRVNARVIAFVAALVLIAGVVVAAFILSGDDPAPPDGNIPPQVADALERLEQSVEP